MLSVKVIFVRWESAVGSPRFCVGFVQRQLIKGQTKTLLSFSSVTQPEEHRLACGPEKIELGLSVAALTSRGLDPFSGHLAAADCSRFRIQNGSVWYEVESREGMCGNTLRVPIPPRQSLKPSSRHFQAHLRFFFSSSFQVNSSHAVYSNSLFIYFANTTSFVLPESFHFRCVYPLDTDASLDVAVNPFLE